MSFLSPTRQALTRSDLQLIDRRRFLLVAGCTALLFAVVAFVVGVWVGRTNVEPAPMPVVASAPAPRKMIPPSVSQRSG